MSTVCHKAIARFNMTEKDYSVVAPYYGPTQILSGTNCQGAAAVFVNYPEYTQTRIRAARLYLNGELVKSWTYSGPEQPAPAGMMSRVMNTAFDSTHFPDGTAVTVRLDADLNNGTTVTGSGGLGTVYNKAFIYTEPSVGPQEADAVGAALAAMNHTVIKVSGTLLSPNAFLDYLTTPTAVYFGGHGWCYLPSTSLIWLDTDMTDPYVVYPGDIAGVSRTFVPKMNITLMYSCAVSQGNADDRSNDPGESANDFAEAWGVSGTTATNQASVDWRVRAYQYVAGATAFWQELQNGGTAHQARDAMVSAEIGRVLNPDEGRSHASCWGDYHATLHRLYTGSDVPALETWHDFTNEW